MMNHTDLLDLDLNRLASKAADLPIGLDRRIDAVEAMLEAAGATITRRVTSSHDYVPGKISYSEDDIDPRTYAEETDLDDIVCSTRTTAAVTTLWVPGIGPAVVQTITHRDNVTTTTDYAIRIDTEADDYDGRKMREAAEAVRILDAFSAACLAFELDTAVEIRETYLREFGRFVPIKLRASVDVAIDHRRGCPEAEPYAHTEETAAPGEKIAFLSSVVPDSDGSSDGVAGVIRIYDHHHPCFSGYYVPAEVYLRTVTEVYPTVAAVIGSPVVIDYVDYHLTARAVEVCDEASVDDLDDDPEPEIYGFDPDDDERPLHSAAAAYADFVGARPY